MLEDLEKELAAWRAKKNKGQREDEGPKMSPSDDPAAKARRTVNVNGREIVIVKKGKKGAA